MGLDVLTGRTKQQVSYELTVLSAREGLEEAQRAEAHATGFTERVRLLQQDYPNFSRVEQMLRWAESEQRAASARVRTKEGQIASAMEKLRVSLEGER